MPGRQPVHVGEGSMRQAFLPGPGEPLAMRVVPIPTPSDAEILLRVRVATVCALTDLHIMAGIHPPHDSGVGGMLPHDLRIHLARDGDPLRRHYPQRIHPHAPFPATMGHEAAGTVVALGPAANEPRALVFSDQRLSIGDRVLTYKVPAAYGEYTCLSASNVVRIPGFMSDDEGSLIEPLLPNYNCLRRCWSLRDHRNVVVLGQGFQGLLATQIVRALGAELVIVTEPLLAKRRLALELGADVALDPMAVSVVDEVERLTRSGGGVDLVVECVGAEATVSSIPYLVRRGGMVAQIGGVETPVTLDYGYVHFKHITIVPSDYVRDLREVADQVAEIFELIHAGTVQLGRLVTHRFPLSEINRAFDLLRMCSEAVVKVAIDVTPTEP